MSKNVKFFEQEMNKGENVKYSNDSSGETETDNKSAKNESDPEDDLNETVIENRSSVGNNEKDDMKNISVTGDLKQGVQPAKIAVRRASSRTRKPFQPYQMGHFAFLVEHCTEIEPNSVDEAKKSENREKWIIAMNEEIEAHKENGTWQLTD